MCTEHIHILKISARHLLQLTRPVVITWLDNCTQGVRLTSGQWTVTAGLRLRKQLPAGQTRRQSSQVSRHAATGGAGQDLGLKTGFRVIADSSREWNAVFERTTKPDNHKWGCVVETGHFLLCSQFSCLTWL